MALRQLAGLKIADSSLAAWLLACAALALGESAACAQEATASKPVEREDFAYAVELEVTPGLAVQTLLVPPIVYRTVLRPDLGDMRVVNAEGTILPHALRTLGAPEARGSLRVRGWARTGQPGIYDFDLKGAFPAQRMRVLLPSINTQVHAAISTANAPGDPPAVRNASAIRARTSKRIYDEVHSGSIYRLLQEGSEVSSPAIELDARRIRYVSIVLREDATLEAPPELEIEYSPAQLIFIARDPAPFELVYGSHAAQPPHMTVDTVLAPLSPSARDALLPSSVKLGTTVAIAGAAALTAPPPPRPIKIYVLWGVLIAGTLGITALALRLLRKLD